MDKIETRGRKKKQIKGGNVKELKLVCSKCGCIIITKGINPFTASFLDKKKEIISKHKCKSVLSVYDKQKWV